MPVTNECPFRLFRPYLSKDTTLRPAKQYQKFLKILMHNLYTFFMNVYMHSFPSIIRDLRLSQASHFMYTKKVTPVFLLQILSLVRIDHDVACCF
jgi:hypothetical protein